MSMNFLHTLRVKRLLRRGRPDKALKEFQRVPESYQKVRTAILNMIGDFYYSRGNLANAQNHWKKSLDIQYQQWQTIQKLNRVNSQIALEQAKRISRQDDPYLKYISSEDRHKKTGMNICFLGANIGDNLFTLMRYLNKHTIHKARYITFRESFTQHNTDIFVDPTGKGNDEAEEIVRNADFFHIGGNYENFGLVNFSDILTSANCVFQYFGSYLRENAKEIFEMHRRTGFKAIVWQDWTMLSQLPGGFYHIQKIFELDDIPLVPPATDVVRIAHSPTRRHIKSTDLFLSVMEDLKRRYPVEVVLIEGISHEKAMEMKQSVQITYDQLILGFYANSAIESMAMGHVVICGLNNFLLSFFPDCPIVSATEDTLKNTIEYFLKNPEQIAPLGLRGREWVERLHHPKNVAPKYVFLYDLIKNGPRIIESPAQFFID
jgi:glycosyltransferase involved in cell wall biosynthesis